MSFDSQFIKGNSHSICQDYCVISGNSAILSDGCSGSKNTDFGARILSHITLEIFSSYRFLEEIKPTILQQAIFSAKKVANHLGLNDECLDATLHALIVRDNRIYINSIGDGVIYIKYTDGHTDIIELDTPSGYPYYLSYKLSASREEVLLEHSEYGTTVTKNSEILYSNKFYYYIELPKEDIDSVLIFSDGIKQLYKNSELVKLEDLIPLFDIKLRKGEFVKRLFNKIFNQYGYNSNYDDLSCIGYVKE